MDQSSKFHQWLGQSERLPFDPALVELQQRLDRLESSHRELGCIRATLEVNFGAAGRSVAGLKIDSAAHKSTNSFLVEVLKQLVLGTCIGIHVPDNTR